MSGVRSTLIRLGSSQSVVLGILCLGVFSTALDQTVVVAALPLLMVDLEIPLTDLDKASWIITGYLISYTVAMPLAGRLSDVYGRVRIFQVALVVFALGSGVGSACAELHLDCARQGDTGSRGRRHGPDRPCYGRGSRIDGKEGACHRTGGRLG